MTDNAEYRPMSAYLQFVLFWSVSLLAFWQPVLAVAALAWSDDRYTHTILMPFITLGLICLHRDRIFVMASPCPSLAIPFLLAGAGTGFLYRTNPWLSATALVLVWMAGFLWIFGLEPFRRALVPLLFLILFIPLPPSVVEMAEVGLQKSSAEVTAAIFSVTGTRVFRQDLRFSLPGITIEVAKECSGIRSTIGLLIATSLLSYLFLRSALKRTGLVLLAVPITIFKNAVRIATLSWLGAFVSKDYLDGDLHHRGGPLFSLLSLALVLAFLLVLRWSERQNVLTANAPDSNAAEATSTG